MGEIEGFKVRALDAASLQRDVTCRGKQTSQGIRMIGRGILACSLPEPRSAPKT